MYRVLSLLLTVPVCLTNAQVPGFGGCPKVQAQATLDVQKYLGDWFEILAFPFLLESGKCSRATYSLKQDGHIQVYNRGVQKDGKQFSAVGDAFAPNASEPAKLLVKFSNSSPYANYWVVDTDYDTYTLIFSCEPLTGLAHVNFAWILARNRTLDASVVQSLEGKLANFGVDTSKFRATDQSGCP
ncbi:hypothetical protein EGW08_008627 [Elysia chlorotica]|uniref:Apolipoprotein D n=1 Tax=Elysia chlorotica TaxID=188477 RepID=A0A433TPW7_ELYCH|nr:hypothetical protein EGW08_008627 [Elysia chlorotica]